MYYDSFPIANIVKRSHRNLDSLNCQTMKVKPYIILNTSRKHVNYEEDKNKVPMNKPYNIQNKNTVLPRSIAPPFYRQNSHLSRFPPLKIPCYTAKLSYRHPPQGFRHKSHKTNLNSPDSTAHTYLLTAVY